MHEGVGGGRRHARQTPARQSKVELRSSTVLKNWKKASLTVLQRRKGRLVNNKPEEEAGPRSRWVL